jgi:hypothetical protein
VAQSLPTCDDRQVYATQPFLSVKQAYYWAGIVQLVGLDPVAALGTDATSAQTHQGAPHRSPPSQHNRVIAVQRHDDASDRLWGLCR